MSSFPLGPLPFGLHSPLELFPASFTLATGQHEVIDVEQRQHLQLWSPRRSLDKFPHARIGLALLQSHLFHSFVRRFDPLPSPSPKPALRRRAGVPRVIPGASTSSFTGTTFLFACCS